MVPALTASDVASGPNCIPSPRDNHVHSTATPVPERKEKIYALDLLRAIIDKDSTSLNSLLNDPLVAPPIDPFVVLVGASSLSVAALVLGVVPNKFRLWYLGHVIQGLVPMHQLVPALSSAVRRQVIRMQY